MMRTTFALAGAAMILSLAALPAAAQMEEGPRAPTTGLSAGLFGSSASLTLVEDRSTSFGGGLGLSLGYGFTPGFGLHLSTSGAALKPSTGDTQLLGHLDLESRFTFVREGRAWAPHLAVGAGTRSIRWSPPTDGDGPNEWHGNPGLTAGGGVSYFASPSVSLDLALRYGFGNLKQMRCPEGQDAVRTCATSTRVNVGATWYPR
jgi:opacity protein-like surface antigen